MLRAGVLTLGCCLLLSACGSASGGGSAQRGTQADAATGGVQSTAGSSGEEDGTQNTGNAGDAGTSANADTSGTDTAGELPQAQSLDKLFSERDLNKIYESDGAVQIQLNGTTASCTDNSVQLEDGQVKITAAGCYVLSGSFEGSIWVSAGQEDKVQLVLNGVNIHSEQFAAIYVQQADKLWITSAEGTENQLSGGTSYTQLTDDGVDALVYAASDLCLNGSGSLSITAETGHAVVTKDELRVAGGVYRLKAEKKGLSAHERICIAGAELQIESGTDGIYAEHADDEGNYEGDIYILSGSVQIQAGDDGIHAARLLQIQGGQIKVTQSEEALEGQTVAIMDGELELTARDDGINAASPSSDSGSGQKGSMQAEHSAGGGDRKGAGRKPGMGFPAGSDAAGNGTAGKATVRAQGVDNNSGGISKDGQTRAEAVDGSSGATSRSDSTTSRSSASGEGAAADGAEHSAQAFSGMGQAPGGRGGMPGGMENDTAAALYLMGGSVKLSAEGDALDSNGSLYISGGSVELAGPSGHGNGILDFGGSGTLSGGTLMAYGGADMAQSLNSESQGIVSCRFSASVPAGSSLQLLDSAGKVLLEITTQKEAEMVYFSSAQVQKAQHYTVLAGEQRYELEAA